MISIVDPEELKNVLRPTVYAAAVDASPSRFGGGATTSEQSRGWSNSSQRDQQHGPERTAVESVSSSQHSG